MVFKQNASKNVGLVISTFAGVSWILQFHSCNQISNPDLKYKRMGVIGVTSLVTCLGSKASEEDALAREGMADEVSFMRHPSLNDPKSSRMLLLLRVIDMQILWLWFEIIYTLQNTQSCWNKDLLHVCVFFVLHCVLFWCTFSCLLGCFVNWGLYIVRKESNLKEAVTLLQMTMDACKTSPVARAYFYDELSNQLEASVLHPSIIEWWAKIYSSIYRS